MKILNVYKGYQIPTEEGYLEITGKNLMADAFSVDEDGNATKTGTIMLTATDIKSYVHDATGKAYDLVQYDDEE